MRQPFFSIVIPTLNEEKCVGSLLNLLAKQEFADFEVIVVDAHSDDKTQVVVLGYTDSIRLKLVVSKNRNLAYQRNLGADNAQGEFLVFFDADTRPGARYLQLIKLTIDKEQATLLTTYLKGDIPGWFYKLVMLGVNFCIETFKLIGKQFACGANLIVRRDKFLAVSGFREDLTMSEDHDLTLRLGTIKCRLIILRQIQLEISLRRIRSEGLISIIYKYAVAIIHVLFFGPMTKKLYDYRMGGHVHKSN